MVVAFLSLPSSYSVCHFGVMFGVMIMPLTVDRLCPGVRSDDILLIASEW